MQRNYVYIFFIFYFSIFFIFALIFITLSFMLRITQMTWYKYELVEKKHKERSAKN